MCNFDVNARYPSLATSDSPADYANHLPGSTSFAYQGTTAITLDKSISILLMKEFRDRYLACVFAFFTACAQKSRVELEVVSKPSLLHLRLALLIGYNRYVYFLEATKIRLSGVYGTRAFELSWSLIKMK